MRCAQIKITWRSVILFFFFFFVGGGVMRHRIPINLLAPGYGMAYGLVLLYIKLKHITPMDKSNTNYYFRATIVIFLINTSRYKTIIV